MKRSSFLLSLALLFPLLIGVENLNGQAAAPRAKENKPAEECTLTLKDAPELLGMRFGMSLDETKAVAPNLELSRRIRKANGVSTSLSSRPNEDVLGVINSYLDDQLFEIDVLYNSANKWDSTVEFIREFSKRLNLPERGWTKTTGEDRYALTCQGFKIEARDQNHIVLSDTAAKTENRKRADEIAILKSKN